MKTLEKTTYMDTYFDDTVLYDVYKLKQSFTFLEGYGIIVEELFVKHSELKRSVQQN